MDLLVEMVFGGVVGVGPVALETEVVALELELHAVRVVAVRTAHVVGVHLGLGERAPDIDLVEDLAVGVVEALVEDRRQVAVEKRRGRVVPVAELRAARMARGAELDLLLRGDVTGTNDQTVIRKISGRAIGWISAHATCPSPVRGRPRS